MFLLGGLTFAYAAYNTPDTFIVLLLLCLLVFAAVMRNTKRRIVDFCADALDTNLVDLRHRYQAPSVIFVAAKVRQNRRPTQAPEEIVAFCILDVDFEGCLVTIEDIIIEPAYAHHALASRLVETVLVHRRTFAKKLGCVALKFNPFHPPEQATECSVEFSRRGWLPRSAQGHRTLLFEQQQSLPAILDLDPAPGAEQAVYILELSDQAEPLAGVSNTHTLLLRLFRCLCHPSEGKAIREIYEHSCRTVRLAAGATERDAKNLDAEPDLLDYLMKHPHEAYATTWLDSPRTGKVTWGLTNRDTTAASKYGVCVPAINGALAIQYETLCNDPDANPTARWLAGFMILFTYLHELEHAWLRHVFRTSLFSERNTPLRQPGESGCFLEGLLLRGDLRVACSDGKVRFGSGSGYFCPNLEPELRFRFRDWLNFEPNLRFRFGSVDHDINWV
ncbi:hypothetical protein B0H16DRAFT_5895 [Mycena metata]|uniref:Uncharacterized protein n=1 Tax=Mycena metata TaxID=1033252 RepID=A0AAD7KHD6_9AGAR|nr:hypothetical protein B0H16DRAFT_5895 [Mycena metata]